MIGLAFIVPFIVARINRWIAIPVVVGEILLGIVLGQFYPELRDDRILIIMSEFGFGILSSSLELRSIFPICAVHVLKKQPTGGISCQPRANGHCNVRFDPVDRCGISFGFGPDHPAPRQ